MRKRFCLALCAIVLLCAAMPALALTEEDLIGTWYLNEITTGGAFLDPSALAMDTTMEIAADGTLTITNLMSGTLTYNWKIDGETECGETTMLTYTLSFVADGTLTLTDAKRFGGVDRAAARKSRLPRSIPHAGGEMH